MQPRATVRDSVIPYSLTRRQFVQGLSAGGALMGMGMLLPARSWALRSEGQREIPYTTQFDLSIGESVVNYTGKECRAVTVNGTVPGPVLRWKEGTRVQIRVRNDLPRGSVHGDITSLHWHGILLPSSMDGVPGLSFDGIKRGESFLYEFDVRQSGTYWYHSHSGFQEQGGMYGALIIDPIEPTPYAFDRDYVVLLSDWTDIVPSRLFSRLKKNPGYDNYYKRTLLDLVRDSRKNGIGATLRDREAWGRMRMLPSDLSDVNGNTYTYLMNGETSLSNWTGIFKPREKVRLRIINGSAMTYFDLRIPGLKMTVVEVDGQRVHPVSVDELRIAAAETFDVIVEPAGQDAYTIFAQDSARTGFVSGTLAVSEGMRADVPAVDKRPMVSMADMGHGSHGGGEGGAGGHNGHDAHGAHGRHEAMASPTHPASERRNPLVDMQAQAPEPRLSDPGIGLRDNGRKVATYADLRTLFADPDGREPQRTIELHLTGHMEKFAWSFDGIKFSDADPIRLRLGERVRITLVNDTMMMHPIHLHGLWSDLEDEQGNFHLRKHTLDMPPGTKRSYRVTADALGRWAYHCHLLYHMEGGMFREVRVER